MPNGSPSFLPDLLHKLRSHDVVFTQPNYFGAMVIGMKKAAIPEAVRAASDQIHVAKAAERKRKRLASFGT